MAHASKALVQLVNNHNSRFIRHPSPGINVVEQVHNYCITTESFKLLLSVNKSYPTRNQPVNVYRLTAWLLHCMVTSSSTWLYDPLHGYLIIVDYSSIACRYSSGCCLQMHARTLERALSPAVLMQVQRCVMSSKF
jgi:hypothetical protein